MLYFANQLINLTEEQQKLKTRLSTIINNRNNIFLRWMQNRLQSQKFERELMKLRKDQRNIFVFENGYVDLDRVQDEHLDIDNPTYLFDFETLYPLIIEKTAGYNFEYPDTFDIIRINEELYDKIYGEKKQFVLNILQNTITPKHLKMFVIFHSKHPNSGKGTTNKLIMFERELRNNLYIMHSYKKYKKPDLLRIY